MPVPRVLLPLTLAAAALLGACSSVSPFSSPASSPRQGTVFAVTDAAELIKFKAGQPSQVLARQPLKGLPAGERLLGIDDRVARGVLYALSSGGRLYTLDTATGQLQPVGSGAPIALPGGRVGFDFNPAADRIRVVGTDGGNLRLHPDTGRLFTVGALGTGAVDEAAFDIADIDNGALAALRQHGMTRLHGLDLATGRAQLLGTVGDGRALWGMAIEP